jgi:hypothetical protein
LTTCHEERSKMRDGRERRAAASSAGGDINPAVIANETNWWRFIAHY